jgi:hypothetical protein
VQKKFTQGAISFRLDRKERNVDELVRPKAAVRRVIDLMRKNKEL